MTEHAHTYIGFPAEAFTFRSKVRALLRHVTVRGINLQLDASLGDLTSQWISTDTAYILEQSKTLAATFEYVDNHHHNGEILYVVVR